MNMCRYSSEDDDGYRKVAPRLKLLCRTIQTVNETALWQMAESRESGTGESRTGESRTREGGSAESEGANKLKAMSVALACFSLINGTKW
jgi:hypothetical protein